MATALEIVNQALYRVGQGAITSGEFTTPTTEPGRVVAASWPFVRREVLRTHSWNAVTRRQKLRRELYASGTAIKPDFDFTSIFRLPNNCLRVLEVDTTGAWRVERAPVVDTAVAAYSLTYPQVVNDEIFVTTAAAHNLTTGDLVYLSDATDTDIEEAILEVTVALSTTFTLPEFDTSGFVDGSGGGGVVMKMTMETSVLCDESNPVGVLYIEDVEDPSSFDAILTEALVLRMAAEIAERITNSRTRRELLLVEYDNKVTEARGSDSAESSPMSYVEDTWLTVRN